MFAKGSIFSFALCTLLSISVPVSAAPPPSPEAKAIARAAVEAAELSPQKTRSLRLRLHLSSLLPQLRVTFGRGWQLSSSRDYLLETPATENDRINYAITASWDLSRLVVPHEELHLFKEEQRRATLRLRLEERLARLLAARCRLQKPEHPTDRTKLDELEATLIVLTGGKTLPAVDEKQDCPAAPLRIGLTASANTPASADDVLAAPAHDGTAAHESAEPSEPASSPDE